MKKISRRSFLAAAGVSAAALALTACGGSSKSTAAPLLRLLPPLLPLPLVMQPPLQTIPR